MLTAQRATRRRRGSTYAVGCRNEVNDIIEVFVVIFDFLRHAASYLLRGRPSDDLSDRPHLPRSAPCR